MPNEAVLQRVLKREKQARKEAESLLEAKSRELYHANQSLLDLTQELRQQNERFETILNTAAEGILTLDIQGNVVSFNQAAEAIFGLSSDCQYRLASLLEDDACVDLRILQTNQTVSLGVEEALAGKRVDDGKRFDIELTLSSVETIEGYLFVAMVRDVSNRRLLERQLSLAQKMESVGQLAAGVAHEINTPIQYIGENACFLGNAFEQIEKLFGQFDHWIDQDRVASVEDLKATYAEWSEKMRIPFLREQIPTAIEQASVGVERVATIVGAMKEFSHPGTEEKSPVDINRAIEVTLTVARNEWRYHSEVEMELDDSIPWVPGLAAEINQALLNLVINAAHAIADSGRENGKIQIATRREDDLVAIEIKDNGVGMPKHIRSRVFEPFFTTKDVGRGTGQGLAIVYSVVVEKHGGHIDIDSVPSFGTKITLRFPIS